MKSHICWKCAPTRLFWLFFVLQMLVSVCHACSWLCFCNMRALGCVFVCVRLQAQYPSHSLWSLRGSFPPALPPVSVLLRAPGLQWLQNLPDLLIKPIRSAPLPQTWLPFPITGPIWAGFPSRAQFSWVKMVCSPSLINDSWATTFYSVCCTVGSHLSVCKVWF